MQTQLKLSTQANDQLIQQFSAIYVKSNSIQQEGSP
jgi:hypothetical protein